MMPPYLSDLLDFYKLQADCSENHVIHTSYVKDRAKSVQRVRVEQRWDNVKRIGHGTFGEVWLQKGDKSAERAVKKLSKYKMEDLDIDYKRELDALAKFNTPRIRQEQVIVEFLGWFESDATLYLAMEYCPLGDLSKHIPVGEITEAGAKQITRDLLEALTIIHDEGFTHRDIKPHNIFVMSTSPQWWVKIADFGISKRINSDQTALRTRIGTPRYLAPEVEDDELLDSNYTQAVDIWSLGCVVYHVLVQEPPFLTTSSKSKPFPEAQLESRSLDMALKFLRTLLVRDPSQRATARDALSSDWLLNANGSLDVDFGPSRAESEVQDDLFSQDTKGRQPLQTAFNSAVAGLTIADNPTKLSRRTRSLLAGRFGDAFKRSNAPTLEPSMSDRERMVTKSGYDSSSTATVIGPKIIASEHPMPSTSEVRGHSEGSKPQYPNSTRRPIGAGHPQNQILGQGSSDLQSPLSCRLQHGNLEDTEGQITDYFDPRKGIRGRENVAKPEPYDNRSLDDSDPTTMPPSSKPGIILPIPSRVQPKASRDPKAATILPTFSSSGAQPEASNDSRAFPKASRAIAVFHYEPVVPNELRMLAGDIITGIYMLDIYWWIGENHGFRGIFPQTYVRLIEDNDYVRAPNAVALWSLEPCCYRDLLLRQRDLITNITWIDDFWWMGENPRGEYGYFPRRHVEIISDAILDEPPVNFQSVVAMRDYKASETNELQFKRGERITVLRVQDPDWWFGKSSEGLHGQFPSHYVLVESIPENIPRNIAAADTDSEGSDGD